MNKKKEVWVISFNLGEIKAGPAIRFMRYAKYFDEMCFKTVFITTSENAVKTKTSPYYSVKGMDAVNPETLNNLVLDEIIGKKSLLPNAVVFLALDFKSYFKMNRCQKKGVKLIYISTMQFDLSNKAFGVKRNLFSKIILKYLYAKTFNQLDFLVSSTSILQQDYNNLGVKPAKLKVIYNGVDTEKYKQLEIPNKVALRHKYNIPDNKIVFLFVGLFIERKGVDYLINLWSKYQNAYPNADSFLLMVGDEMLDIIENSKEFKFNWPQLRSKAELNSSIRFMPFQNEIQDLFAVSDVFVFPSLLEGMPNVLLEAMSSGLSVITRKFAGFSNDYGTEGVQFEILDGDFQKDINKIRLLYLNKMQRDLLSNNARKLSLERFSINNSISEYIQLFS